MLLKKYFSLISQGERISDRLKICLAILYCPLKKTMRLPFSINIKNYQGNFACGKNFDAVWIASTFHEPGISKIIKKFKGDVFLDIGANIGKFSIILANQKFSGKIYSFEPDKANYELLRKNISLNKSVNVLPVNLAVSNVNSESEFYVSEKGCGGHSILPREGRKVKIKTTSIDKFLENLPKKRKILIKIDVEGFELPVFKGMTDTISTKDCKIIFETHSFEKLKEIKKMLMKKKYHIHKIGDIDYVAEKKG